MMSDPCFHGESAARAARTGEWSDELAAHAAECVSCRESDRLVRWLTELAERVDAECTPLPDPHLIWLKAGIPGQSRSLARALLPIRIASPVAAAGLGAIVGHLGTRGWNVKSEWLASAGPLVPELPDLPGPYFLATLLIAVAILLPLLITTTEA